ncbi:MAG: polyprenol monophosphomannose synthase [Pirellulaceae bacterium]
MSSSAEIRPPRVLVAVATYNEIENLPQLVERISAAMPQADILVIDDDSPDGTGRWCDEQKTHNPRLHCLHRTGKRGLGSAVIEAMRYAIRQNYHVMVNLDADLSHPPELIPKLIETMDQIDPDTTVVLGSRYVEGGGIIGWPWRRHVMSRMINTYAAWMLRLPIRDCSGSFRAYPIPMLRRLNFDDITSQGYSFFEEILWRLLRVGARFEEVPFTFVERKYGTSKINMTEAIKAVFILFGLGVKTWTKRY